jgi:hypothetical protein
MKRAFLGGLVFCAALTFAILVSWVVTDDDVDWRLE